VAFFVSFPEFERLLGKWAQERPVYVPRYLSNSVHYQKFTPGAENHIAYDGIRAVEPLKVFFFRPKERVAQYPSSSSRFERVEPGVIIVGAKSCDIRSAECLDETFMKGDTRDPLYVERRGNSVIVSCDCSFPAETCFCTLLGLKPYPEEGFDLNLSRISTGLVIEVGSEKGERLLSQDRETLPQASAEQVEARDGIRATALSKAAEQNEEFRLDEPYQRIIETTLESPEWNKYVGRCKECAACLSVCPTCHCFLLYDQRANDEVERFRVWDFCYHRGYARMGGGANARPTGRDRFKNKYIKKFEFYASKFGMYACTGCGRCIEACLANIDMRRVLRDLGGT